MVHVTVVRPRHEAVLAPPVMSVSQMALIAAVWLAMMAAFGLMAYLR